MATEEFSLKDFEEIKRFSGQVKAKGNEQHQATYEYLKNTTYKKVESLAKEVAKKVWGAAAEVEVRKAPLNQAQKFEYYQWAKVYPTSKAREDRILAFVIAIDDAGFLTAKIDTVSLSDSDERRKKYFEYRGPDSSSPIVMRIPAQKVVQMSRDELSQKVEVAFQRMEPNFIELQNLLLTPQAQEPESNIKSRYSKEHLYNVPLNLILYGPPGTGKTYSTINEALKILEGTQPSPDSSRDELHQRFESYKRQGRVEFVTFHQSFAYEDFIEGIKPVFDTEEAGDSLSYRMEDGIFKTICYRALHSLLMSTKAGQVEAEKKSQFEEVYAGFVDSLNDRLENGEEVHLSTLVQNNPIQVVGATSEKVVIDYAGKGHTEASPRWRQTAISKSSIQELYENYESIEDLKPIKKLRSLVGQDSSGAATIFSFLKKYESEQLKEQPSEWKQELDFQSQQQVVDNLLSEELPHGELDAEPFVLIIDEINRGNISSIFGELITLIESDKRLGGKERVLVRLPYSKKLFAVPSNLYIIGTMNTADRSIEALDTALRRRFSFKELPSRPGILRQEDIATVGNIDLAQTLEVINQRIQRLLDADHAIGHAYFFALEGKSNQEKPRILREIFDRNIIPLLKEYFYGDFGKIELVLGPAFVTKDSAEQPFAKGASVDGSDYASREVYRFTSFEDDVAFLDAVRSITQ